MARNFATIFDGSITWVGTTLGSRNCLIARTNCRESLSIGFKIKLTRLTKSPEQRYIVDTGVLSIDTRGIAIYLQHGNLFCVVMTMTGEWKVCVKFLIFSSIYGSSAPPRHQCGPNAWLVISQWLLRTRRLSFMQPKFGCDPAIYSYLIIISPQFHARGVLLDSRQSSQVFSGQDSSRIVTLLTNRR